MNQRKRMDSVVIHPLIFIVIIPVLTINGYGYDSASSCDPNASRKGRSSQLLKAIPCDLSSQAYCNLPGTAYPWHAVRRFVHENQGLMRRMYGDIRHISVLKTEIDNNEIDIDDIYHTAERYSRMDTSKKMKHIHPVQFEYSRDKSNDLITEPHFRPTQKVTTSKTPTKASTMTGSLPIITESNEFLVVNVTEDMSVNSKEHDKIDMKKLSSIANLEMSDGLLNNISSGTVSTPEKSNENESIQTQEILLNMTNDNSKNLDATTISPADIKRKDKESENSNDSSSENLVNSSEPVSEFKDEVNPAEAIKNTANGSKKQEGQLFQDTAQKETPMLNVRGVNACPVKEEVVAPFWANNTRGEVLALLNLYPFEQYVHWEKCAFEFKQMYCREGCRCEQQYRLHRLLAYDPHNECRGIFSDWFRFPSCCICKCYDLPFDLRVTSRSPRTALDESMQYVEDELKNAIYDHAIEEWYRPKDVEPP
ncbi:protein spaetzle 4 isoform X2 [Toxorhynchites rutilus septentrionalis]|uniref:protein spaetzle 4 isoform X2 n=1 Tax=Toxorhynchites rutilus septentrionalis TaxID=329112 RepID=UPI00247B1EB0|nr:protein spaetzle 4 isoform X2 [Toxorhynchites rutilus septentrionalis]